MDNLMLIDTDILIDVGRNVMDAVAYLERLQGQMTLAISLITQMELIVGCQSKLELHSMEKFLIRFKIINLNENIANTGVGLLREYRLSHGL